MNNREVMQKALEALEILLQTPTARRQAWDASAALRAALAEPQEPVAFAFRHSDGSWHDISETEHSAGMTALYTHPAAPASG